MTPVHFTEVNTRFGPPPELEESQCMTIPAFVGSVTGGSCDGSSMVVVAWKPTEEELAELNAGNPIFVSMLGGLPPHFLTTSFALAKNPA